MWHSSRFLYVCSYYLLGPSINVYEQRMFSLERVPLCLFFCIRNVAEARKSFRSVPIKKARHLLCVGRFHGSIARQEFDEFLSKFIIVFSFPAYMFFPDSSILKVWLTACIPLFILLTHEGSHREVYWDFQRNLKSSAGPVPRVDQTTGSVHPQPTLPNRALAP